MGKENKLDSDLSWGVDKFSAKHQSRQASLGAHQSVLLPPGVGKSLNSLVWRPESRSLSGGLADDANLFWGKS